MPAPTTPNTTPARTAKARKRRAAAEACGTLGDVKRKLWAAIERVDELMDAENDPDATTVLKATHALVQACGAYTKVLEVGEIETRLAEVEARLAASASAPTPGMPLRRVG